MGLCVAPRVHPSLGRSLRVLFIEPYFGGSHKAFAEGFAERLPFDTTIWSLPARKWKWRMRGAAVTMAERLRAEFDEPAGGAGKDGSTGARSPSFDVIVASSMLDLAGFRGLTAGILRAPALLVMHENQFEYPVTKDDERDMHFALTNLTSCLATDRIVWNSSFNQESMLNGMRGLVRRMPDERFDATSIEERVRAKSVILPPPIDMPAELTKAPSTERASPRPTGLSTQDPPDREESRPLRILWNHRWEHDKAPEVFFDALYRLADKGRRFELAVLGEAFERGAPACFEEARERLAEHIVSWGFAPTREEYWRELSLCDVVVSTATHEFFGMSVAEAVAAGCRPMLPAALSYPENYPVDTLYSDFDDLVERLDGLASATGALERIRHPDARLRWQRLGRGFSWEALAPAWTDEVGDRLQLAHHAD